VGFEAFKNVARVLKSFVERPAVARGLQIPPAPAA
jgi:GST-like protein